jgi:predicted exporter
VSAFARPAARYLAALAVVTILAFIAAREVRIETDFSAFLPPTATQEERLLVSQLREGLVSRLMLVALEGADDRTLARASRALASRLASDPAFEFVANGSREGLATQLDVLMRHRYDLSPRVEPSRFTAEGLRAALQQTLDDLASTAGILTRDTVARDPTGELPALLMAMGAPASPTTRHGVWFSADGRRAFLLAQTRAAGFDSEGQDAAMAQVRGALAPGVNATLTGPGAFAAESRRLIRADTRRLGLWSSALILALLVVVYRSPLAIGLVLVPTALGLLAGVLVVHAAFGAVHAITLAFAATLVGESIDYPSYVLLNAQPGETARRAARRVGGTLMLAVLTTVASASALALSSFQGLAQLGLLTMVGVVVAGLAARFLIPCLLDDRVLTFPRLWLPAFDSLARARWPSFAAMAAVALAAVFLFMKHPGWWENDLASLSPVPAHLRALDAELRREMAAPEVSVFVASTGSSEAEALANASQLPGTLEKARDEGLLRGFDSPARLLPAQEVQAERRAALPPDGELSQNLRAALRGLPFRPDAFAPFLQDVTQARAAPFVTRATYDGTPIGSRLQAQVLSLDGRWIALTSITGITDAKRLSERVAGPDTSLVDLRQVSNAMLEGFRHEAMRQAALGALAIVALLAIGLRSGRRALRVTLPVAGALLLTVATLAALGHRIGVFHLVALLLVLGIGLNYALFFERPPEDEAERERTRLALALCGASTVVTFGILATSATPVLRAIGASVAIGATWSLLLAATGSRKP